MICYSYLNTSTRGNTSFPNAVGLNGELIVVNVAIYEISWRTTNSNTFHLGDNQ